jgi:hypothetical protein
VFRDDKRRMPPDACGTRAFHAIPGLYAKSTVTAKAQATRRPLHYAICLNAWAGGRPYPDEAA